MAKKQKTEADHKSLHRRIVIIIGIAATVAAIAITSTGLFNQLESRSVDWRFKSRGSIRPRAPVVIVAIDDDSFPAMPDRWTWPRTVYARVIKNLNKLGAKIIGFDMDFSKSTARFPKEDKAFADAIKEAKNVVVGMVLNIEGNDNYAKRTLIYPIPEIKDSSLSLGLVGHAYDADNVVRQSYLLDEESKEKILTLSLAMLGAYYHLDRKDLKIEGNRVVWGGIRAPFDRGGRFNINFTGPAKTFETVPFYKVYFNKDLNEKMFKDKIVLIGATADILHDVFAVPFTENGLMMPGVEIYANVINTIFTGEYIARMNMLTGFLLLLGIGILTSFLIFGIQAWQGLIVVVIEMLAYVFLARYLFQAKNYLIDFVNPLFSMLLCYLSISTYKVGVEEREKRKIKNIFSRYVDDVLVTELLKSEEIKLGGERKEISVLFSDIRGFTSMSEKIQPEEVVHILNEYLSEMTDAIFVNNGTLDKFIGDAVMALFGTPVFYADHAMRALKTAFLMKKRLAALNEKWEKEGKHRLAIGIGINTGVVIAGNMGSMRRMEYTVIGDTVNLASRLESLNKNLGTEILISVSTYEQVKEHVRVKRFDNITVKGKEESMTVYEVLELIS
jgi:adenylate cyclase